jgi:hypothetical protein
MATSNVSALKFCVKVCKSRTETFQMSREAFRKHSLSWTAVFEWLSCFKAGKCKLKLMSVQGNQAPAKRQKMFKKFEKSSTKIIAK